MIRTLAIALLVSSTLCAQGNLRVNEFSSGTPDFVELYNCGPGAVDASGWTVSSFYDTGSGPVLEPSFTLPGAPGSGTTSIPAGGFLILEDFGTAGMPGTLPNSISTGFNYFWTDSRTVGVFITDDRGAGVDYVWRDYWQTGGTPPFLPVGTTWSGQYVGGTTNFSARQWDGDSNTATDWGDNAASSENALNPNQAGGCTPYPPGVSEFQANSAASSLTINGGASAVTLAGTPVSIELGSSLVGNMADLIVHGVSPPVGLSRGGSVTPGLQTFNLPLDFPNLLQFFQYGTGSAVNHPGIFNIAFPTPPVAIDASAQQWVMDPGSPDGFTLSQAVGLRNLGTSIPTPLAHPGPTGDDSSMEVVFANAPLNAAAFTVPFCGTSYDRLHVNSNGSLSFGGSDTDFSPTVGEAASDDGRFGVWTDLSPNQGGSISYDLSGGVFTTVYSDVRYYSDNSSGGLVLSIDGTGVCTIDVSALLPNALSNVSASAGDAQFLGLSGGNQIGATDGGGTYFTVGASGANVVATDMIYDFVASGGLGSTAVPGLVDSISALQGGMGLLTFVPGANAGEYTWSGN